MAIDERAVAGAVPSFTLSDEHRVFQDVCRSFVERDVHPPRSSEAEETSTFPAELWGRSAGRLPRHRLPRSTRRQRRARRLALAILSEELAHASGGLAITPLVSSYMAAPAPRPLRHAEQKER